MEKVYFETIRGKRVFCILTEFDISQKRIVIMSHGFRGSSTGPARQFVDFSRFLVKKGYSVLRFDQPNSGNSEGDFVDSSFKEWVDTIGYFVDQFNHHGYEVCLMGQSMGAAACAAASAEKELQGRVRCLLLWVPDPKSTFDQAVDRIYEEEGQKYRGRFWQEAKESDFFGCLAKYGGGIHLVYGEIDRYIEPDLRMKVIDAVMEKGQSVMVLAGQDHSPWQYDDVQTVFQEQIKKLNECFSTN